MKTKQIYIDLLEKALLEEDDFDLGEFEGYFLEQLKKDSNCKSNHYKYLISLSRELSNWNKIPSDSELLNHIKYTLEILKMTPSALSQMESEKEAKANLEQYHAELPSKLFHLLAQAYQLGIDIKFNYCNKNVIVELSAEVQSEEHDRSYPPNYYTYTWEETINLQGRESEYWDVKTLVDKVQDIKNKEIEKAELLHSAKSKVVAFLTSEELAVLKEKGL